jgi:hypothetical protein
MVLTSLQKAATKFTKRTTADLFSRSQELHAVKAAWELAAVEPRVVTIKGEGK